jgi:hypothetical protein
MSAGQYDPDSHFGWCPECGRSDGYRNIGRQHWYFCDAHRVRWSVGSNLFSSWRHEDDATWQRNAEHLEPYREVDGSTPTAAMLQHYSETGRLFDEPEPISEAEQQRQLASGEWTRVL